MTCSLSTDLYFAVAQKWHPLLFCRVSIFLVFLIIPIPVVNYSNIPKTWQDFVQNCIAYFASSSAKHSFSNVFYPSGGGHVGDPEVYRIPPVILWREPSTNTRVSGKKLHNKSNLLHYQEIKNHFDFESQLKTKRVTKRR